MFEDIKKKEDKRKESSTNSDDNKSFNLRRSSRVNELIDGFITIAGISDADIMDELESIDRCSRALQQQDKQNERSVKTEFINNKKNDSSEESTNY